MADMFLNLDLSGGPSSRRAENGNPKHQRFMKNRRSLEKRGFLKQKQLPPKVPNKKPEHQSNSWDQGRQNGLQGAYRNHAQRSEKSNSSLFHSHQQGAPSALSRTVTVGTSGQSGTLSVTVNSASNHSHVKSFTSKLLPSKGGPSTELGTAHPATPGAKDTSVPSLQQQNVNLLSEFESGIPSASPAPSYKMVAIDCEMVGTGPKGSISALARCSIVGYHGDVVYDKYVRPAGPVTDYRTKWSGIRREHLFNAIPFAVAQKEVSRRLRELGAMVAGKDVID